MSVYLVIMKIRDMEENQKHFEQLLTERYEGFQMYKETWLISTYESQQEITDELFKYLSEVDTIAVIPVDRPFAFKKMLPGTTDWLSDKF